MINLGLENIIDTDNEVSFEQSMEAIEIVDQHNICLENKARLKIISSLASVAKEDSDLEKLLLEDLTCIELFGNDVSKWEDKIKDFSTEELGTSVLIASIYAISIIAIVKYILDRLLLHTNRVQRNLGHMLFNPNEIVRVVETYDRTKEIITIAKELNKGLSLVILNFDQESVDKLPEFKTLLKKFKPKTSGIAGALAAIFRTSKELNMTNEKKGWDKKKLEAISKLAINEAEILLALVNKFEASKKEIRWDRATKKKFSNALMLNAKILNISMAGIAAMGAAMSQ